MYTYVFFFFTRRVSNVATLVCGLALGSTQRSTAPSLLLFYRLSRQDSLRESAVDCSVSAHAEPAGVQCSARWARANTRILREDSVAIARSASLRPRTKHQLFRYFIRSLQILASSRSMEVEWVVAGNKLVIIVWTYRDIKKWSFVTICYILEALQSWSLCVSVVYIFQVLQIASSQFIFDHVFGFLEF